jgi:PIN domain nuclease of toxin-antitoxin system
MRLLLDSQAVIWYVDQDHLLSTTAHSAITDPNNDLLVSAATIWEIAIKVGLGKLTLSLPYRQWMNQAVTDLDLTILPVTIA